MLSKLTIFALLQVSQISAWSGEPHFIIAKKAYEILKVENPSALQKAEDILGQFSDQSTKLKEQDYPFVECVTWPDDIKRAGGGWQAEWHFDDQPVFGDDTPRDQLDVKTELKNITTVMPQLYAWLGGKPDKSSLAYTTVMAHAKSEDEGKAQALRLLIHFYGDIHQPLHTANRYTKDMPSGDRGGNDFLLKKHSGASELHAVWDTVIYTHHRSVKRPFNGDTWKQFGERTTDFMEGITVPASTYKTLDFSKFRDESSAIAQHVYDGLTSGKDQVIPDKYLAKYEPIAKERGAIAAYRLAYAIEQLFGANTEKDAILV